MKRWLIVLLTLLVLLSAAACKKSEPQETDPNAVLTDSDVPLDLGAEVWEFGEQESEAF